MTTTPSSPTKNAFLGADGGWDEESTRELLLKMKKVVPIPDSSKYKTLLEKYDWAKVASGLKFSEGECKSQWGRIYKKLRKYKTLSDLIEDSLEYVENPYKGCVKKHPDHPKRPLTPYFRFFLEEREKYAASHKNLTNLQITTILSKKYRLIPNSEKERYLAEWKTEMCEYRVKMEKFKSEHPEYYDKMPPRPSRTPLQIFNQECIGNLSPKKKRSKKEVAESLKNKYHVLEDDQKLPYILKAMEEWEKYKEELEMYKKTHPSFVPGSIHKKSVLTKDDWRIYDKSLGRPNRPPANGYNLFCTRLMVSDAMKHLSSRERIMECGQRWKLLTNTEKQTYHKEFMQMRENYRIEQKSFLKKLTPKEREEYLARKNEAESKKTTKKKNSVTIKEEEELSDAGSASSSDEEDEAHEDSTSDESSSSSESSDDEDDEEEKKEEKEPNGDVVAKGTLGPVRPTTPISALFLYQKAHKAKLAAKHPDMALSDITLTLARRFVNLPSERKAKYLQKEKEQRALYSQEIQKYLLAESKPAKPTAELKPITGEQVYHDQNREAYLKKYNGSQKKAEEALRKAWTQMSKERRKKYINVAHELNAKNIAEHQAAQVKKNQDEMKSAVPEKKLSQKEIKSYLALEPKKVPKDALVLFKKEHRPKLNHLLPGARNQELHRLWSEMNASTKIKYKQRAKEGLLAYNKKLQRWINSLPPQVKVVYESPLVKKKIEKPESIPKAIIANGKKRKAKVVTLNAKDKGKKKKLGKKVNKESDSSDESSDEEDSSSSSNSDSDDSSSSSSDDDSSSDSDSDSAESADNNGADKISAGNAKEEESSDDSSSSSSSDDDASDDSD